MNDEIDGDYHGINMIISFGYQMIDYLDAEAGTGIQKGERSGPLRS